LYKELVAEGLFANDTDVALAFSTDGFKATVKGVDKKLSTKAPEGWPFVCFNLNEPPAQRVKLCNVFFQGIKLTKMTKQNKTKQNKTKQKKNKKGVAIGNFNPKDLDSFMAILVDKDFLPLQEGLGIHFFDLSINNNNHVFCFLFVNRCSLF